VRALHLAELAFVGLAAVAVHAFVRMAMRAEQRRVCAPLCALAPAYAGINRTAPDFELPTLTGERVRLSDYRGQVVVLNFWTRSCQPCREELPALAALADGAAAGGFAVLTVATDDELEAVREILGALLGRPAPFVVAHDPEAAVVTGQYGTRHFPETWIIDPRGVIRARFDGARDWTAPLVADLLELVRERQRCGVEFSGGRPLSGPRWACQGLLPVGDGQ